MVAAYVGLIRQPSTSRFKPFTIKSRDDARSVESAKFFENPTLFIRRKKWLGSSYSLQTTQVQLNKAQLLLIFAIYVFFVSDA